MLQLGITIVGSRHSAFHETYVYPETLAKFSDDLMAFPESAKTEVVFECGSKDPKFHDFVRMRVFLLKPTGQSALEFESEIHGIPPVSANVHFYVAGFPADFNRLGAALRTWLKDPRDSLIVEWQDA